MRNQIKANQTDREIAKFYGVTPQTLGNYKRGDIGKQRLYRAMKTYFMLPDLADRVQEVADVLRDAGEHETKEGFKMTKLNTGDTIHHSTFGEGTIKEVSTQIIIIDFRTHGTKQIARSFFETKPLLNDPCNFVDFLQNKEVIGGNDDLNIIAPMWDVYKDEYIALCKREGVESEDLDASIG